MKCNHCNSEVAEGINFCPYCGNRIEFPQTLKCVECGTELPNGTKFCPNCGCQIGIPQPKKCSQCGAELEEGERFCSNCGKAVESMPTSQINGDIPQVQEPTSNMNDFGKRDNASSLTIQMEGWILKTKYVFNVVIDGKERYKLNAKEFVETIIPITSNEIKIKTSSLSIYSIDLNLEPNRNYRCIIRLNFMSLPEYELTDENGNVIIKDGEVNLLIFAGSILLPFIGFIYFFIKRNASPLKAILGFYFGLLGLAINLGRLLF